MITSVFVGAISDVLIHKKITLNRLKKSDRLTVDKLDYTGVQFPVNTKHYGRIEPLNKVNINVFGV